MCIEGYNFLLFNNKVKNNMILILNENLSYQKYLLNLGFVEKTDDRSCQ